MKILIVPDVHGRKFWHVAQTTVDEVDKVIFLGDYLDPYSYEGITFEDAVNEFKEILEFKEQYSDKVVLLVGNHDMHYIIKEFMNCSRLNVWRRLEMNELYMQNIDKFRLIYQAKNYLFSHAGIYLEWLDKYGMTLDDLNNLSTFIDNKDFWSTLEDVGHSRGGFDPAGSCVWADIEESLLNDVYPIKQIVGHTQLHEPFIREDIKCLDVRKCFILNTETDEVAEVC